LYYNELDSNQLELDCIFFIFVVIWRYTNKIEIN